MLPSPLRAVGTVHLSSPLLACGVPSDSGTVFSNKLKGCSASLVLLFCVALASVVVCPTNYSCLSAKSLQSSLTLCDAVGCSPPGSLGHGILQARILEWVAVPFSRGSSQPRG